MSKKTERFEQIPPELIVNMVMLSTRKAVEPLAKAFADLYKELYKNPSEHGLKTFGEKLREEGSCK